MKTSALGALLAAACLGGCISLLPSPEPAPMVYGLRAPTVERMEGPPKNLVIAVSEPEAPRSVAGADIVWRRGSEIAFMERAAWDGTAPDLLQAMLIDVMDRRGGVRAVTRVGGGVRADVSVQWDVLAFEVVEDGSTLEAVIQASARLIDTNTRTIGESARFEARAPISQRSGRAAAAALERAASDASLKIADWAISHAEASQPRAASTSR
jgi:cholesterol transport system auxiliary component